MTNRCPNACTRFRRREEEGAIAIYVALLLLVLMIVAAFAIDISRWYVELQRLQRAADAGALAAAPLMPATVTGNPASRAYSEAVSTVGRNGYPASGVTAYNVPGSATKVKVTVQSTVTNSFASLFGFTTTTLQRSGTADFAGPVAIGSPCNVFGREDMEGEVNKKGSAHCAGAGEYWANISGEHVNKARGDAFATAWCLGADVTSGPSPYIDGCSGTSDSLSSPGINYEHAAFPGYVFKVRLKGAGASTLHLEGYDMGWVVTGDKCTEGNLVGISRQYPRGGDSPSSADWEKFCPGDSQHDPSPSPPEGDGSTVVTKITIRGPSNDPYRPLDGPILCGTHTIPGWNRSTPASKLTGPSPDPELVRTFHSWDDLIPGCTPTATAGKDYSVQIQTVGGGGQNRFALRAWLDGRPHEDVSVFAVDRASLFNNVTAGQSKFNFVRLDSSTASHSLSVGFFDIGDAESAPVKATVLQPDSDVPFTNCSGVGPASGPLPGCYVQATKADSGGRWQTITIPIPSTYSCSDDRDQSKCWVRVELNTTAAQADTTTWTASLGGDPVRLVE